MGGIFFDHLGRDGASDAEWDAHKALCLKWGRLFCLSYLVHANVDRPFTEGEREWQLHRRGRYVEFNLVWDRGTRFGLVSNGRTESILMSCSRGQMDVQPQPGPAEQDTLEWLRKGVDWAGEPIKPA